MQIIQAGQLIASGKGVQSGSLCSIDGFSMGRHTEKISI